MRTLRIVLEVEVPEPPQGFAEQALDSYRHEIDFLIGPRDPGDVQSIGMFADWATTATFVPRGFFV